MKTINIMRGYTGLQAFFPRVSSNVQEVTTMNPVSLASGDDAGEAYKPRLLTQRSVRQARRFAH